MTSRHVLLFSMNGESAPSFARVLRESRIIVEEARSFEEVKKGLLTNRFGMCLARCPSADKTQYELLDFVTANKIAVKVVVLAKTGSVEDIRRLKKAGADDVFIAGTLDDRTARAIVLSGGTVPEITEVRKPRHETAPKEEETLFIGQSAAMNEVRTAINLVACSQTAVLITGESGTGKEVVARLIHLKSDRADKPFIALNCAALPKDVIENELFGHEKGAFTGALEKKAGCFELANHGTLFFDEIGEMSPDTQAKLLRAIETKSFRRLGGKDEVTVNVRTLAATNRKMPEILETGEFRKDLYYRFSVIEIDIPPLREHPEDIPLLVDHFLTTLGELYRRPKQQLSNECIEMLMAYNWPGNIRELRNVIERAVVTCRDKILSQKCFPAHISSARTGGSTITLPIGISSREAERRFILQTLAEVGNNKTKAAQILGLSRKTLHNKLREFEAG